MKNALNYLKNNALLIGGFIILFVVLLDYLKKTLGSLFNQGIDFTKLNQSGSTLSDTQARSLAEELHKSMSTWTGTDEETIYRIFTGLTVANFNKIYNFFGIRPYIEMFGVATTEGMGENIDLFGWLNYELTDSEYSKLKLINPDVFSSSIEN